MDEIKRELGYKVLPLSKKIILKKVVDIKNRLGIENDIYIKIEQLLELLINTDMLEICSDNDLRIKGTGGRTDPDRMEIYLPEKVYLDACDGDGWSRFTVAHELGHLFLHRGQFSYARLSTTTQKNHKIFEDAEWQADTFASYFLINPEYVTSTMDASQISSIFGVSYTAASAWIGKNRK